MFREIDKRIKRALGAVRQAFRMVIGQVNSAPGVQLVTGDANAGEPVRDAELMQHYGFTSRPPAGTMAVVLPLGGKSSHGIIVATENSAYRIAGLENGELAIYTHEGAKTVFRNGRVIESDCDIWRLNCRRFEVNASEHSDFSTPVLETDAQAIVRGKLTDWIEEALPKQRFPSRGEGGGPAQGDDAIFDAYPPAARSDADPDLLSVHLHHHLTPMKDQPDATDIVQFEKEDE